MTPKPAACFLSVKSNLMSKMLHEYFFDMQLFKNSELGWVENHHLQLNILQLNISVCYMLCLKEKQPILLENYLRIETKSQKSLLLVKNSVFVQKKKSIFSFLL